MKQWEGSRKKEKLEANGIIVNTKVEEKGVCLFNYLFMMLFCLDEDSPVEDITETITANTTMSLPTSSQIKKLIARKTGQSKKKK